MHATSSRDTTVVYSDFCSDPEYRGLLELFAEALPERRRRLTAAFRSGSFQELRTLAHQLKGAGGGFGFPDLTRCAAELESACKSASPDLVAAALDRMLAYMERIAV